MINDEVWEFVEDSRENIAAAILEINQSVIDEGCTYFNSESLNTLRNWTWVATWSLDRYVESDEGDFTVTEPPKETVREVIEDILCHINTEIASMRKLRGLS